MHYPMSPTVSSSESAGSADLPACHSRRPFNPEAGIHFCAHPSVHIAQQLVTADVCRSCLRWREPRPETFRDFPTKVHLKRSGHCMYLGEETGLRECATCRGHIKLKEFRCQHPAHDTTTISECNTCFDYEPRLDRGTIQSWAVGITTAPRKSSTLERTLRSLVRTGWREGCVFAEPGSEIPEGFDGFSVTWRGECVGAWPNWFLGLSELYLRSPFADAYLMLQDDIVFCQNVRKMVERDLWHVSQVGLISVYSPLTYASDVRGFREVDSRDGVLGALTYIFPNSSVRSLLGDARLIEHRLRGASGLEGIDTVIGQWAHRQKLPVYFHSPSLGLHIGDASTIWPVDSDSATRRATGNFVGEEFDALQSFAHGSKKQDMSMDNKKMENESCRLP